MRKLKKDGSKYSIISYPNRNFFRDSLLGKPSNTFSKIKNQKFIKIVLSVTEIYPPTQ